MVESIAAISISPRLRATPKAIAWCNITPGYSLYTRKIAVECSNGAALNRPSLASIHRVPGVTNTAAVTLSVNAVQQEVQQQGRTTSGMRDRRQHSLAVDVARTSHAPVVRIQVVWPGWPLFGRTTTLNTAACCASVSNISAGQQRNEQVADAPDTVYGSEGWRFESLRARQARVHFRSWSGLYCCLTHCQSRSSQAPNRSSMASAASRRSSGKTCA